MTMEMRRSQVIFRMPVDHVVASMIAHDGKTSDVMLFLPPTEDIARVLAHGATFLPMIKGGKLCIVARDSIASMAVPELPVIPREDDLPVSKQNVIITMKSCTTVEGELRFTAPEGQQRTADHLNDDEPVLVMHGN